MNFTENQAIIDRIASLMMDAAVPVMRQHPPFLAFEAAMGIMFFIGERAGMTAAQVAEVVGQAANRIEENEA